MLPTWLDASNMRVLSFIFIGVMLATGVLVATSVSRAGLRAVLILLLLGAGLGTWNYRSTLEKCSHGGAGTCKFFGYTVPGPNGK